MRINAYLARATGLSRRSADQLIHEGRVQVNGRIANPGEQISESEEVTLDGQAVKLSTGTTTIMLNKPVGYICSRDGQGSHTIYDLLPTKYHNLKPIGRLDKDSSGLLLLTNDGQLANQLTHPRYGKTKTYEIALNKTLQPANQRQIEQGIALEDGKSTLKLKAVDNTGKNWQVTMTEGRNRQIRRTFAVLGYTVTKLHRTIFGPYRLPSELSYGNWKILNA